MQHGTYATPSGTIHYWVSRPWLPRADTLVLLPGLTADHRLFQKQIRSFEGRYNLFTWDPPGHGASWPFRLDFDLRQTAAWLDAILSTEGAAKPVLVGQSMGGYVAQAYAVCCPGKAKALVAIDSSQLCKSSVSAAERWLLWRAEPLCRGIPWGLLAWWGPRSAAATPYGRGLMRLMMQPYAQDRARYLALVGHGYRMLAQGLDEDLAPELPCPLLLLCGTEDRAGSAARFNSARQKRTGAPLEWVVGAGHNSNADAPVQVNGSIERFLLQIKP